MTGKPIPYRCLKDTLSLEPGNRVLYSSALDGKFFVQAEVLPSSEYFPDQFLNVRFLEDYVFERQLGEDTFYSGKFLKSTEVTANINTEVFIDPETRINSANNKDLGDLVNP